MNSEKSGESAVRNRWVSIRFLVLVGLLAGVYFAQIKIPGLFRAGALWSDDPRWWQFFTNGFFSGNWIHLVVNLCSLFVVCSQFARQVRLLFILFYFTLFSAASSYIYFLLFMPDHAWLVGASSGVYSLVGFFCWFLRRDRICLLGIRRLSAPFIPAMLILLFAEFLVATFWIHVVAWQLHVLAFLLSIAVAMAVHAVYAGAHWLAEQNEQFELGVLIVRKMKTIAVTQRADG